MHPSDGQLDAYAKGTLDPAELLSVDDHFAACDSCRARAASPARVGEALRALRSGLLPPESHLTEAQVVELGGGAPASAALASHLRACATCAREVEDLVAWARRRPRLRYVTYAAAAAVVILLLVPAVRGLRTLPDTHPRAQPTLDGLDALAIERQARVHAALRAGVAEPPAFLAGLEGPSEVLMGPSPGESFRLVAPRATVTVSDRPAFRWEPLAGAQAYTVSVLDEALRPLAQSPPVKQAAWTPAQPLPRGRVLVWQVTARRANGAVTAPAPPAPMARFRVVEEDTARALSELARDHPDSHLLLGILYAQAGARSEAERHLAQVLPTDRYFVVASRTRARIRPHP